MKMKKMALISMIMILLTACTSKSGGEIQVSGKPNLVGAYQEMNLPTYWNDKLDNPDELIMSKKQIEDFNKKITDSEATKCIDLDSYKKTLEKDELLEKLRLYTVPEEPRYIDDIAVSDDYYEQLLSNRNEAKVKDENPVRFGVIIQNTQVRNFPTSDVSYSEANDIDFDMGCESVLKSGERVLILHESTDQSWQYVQAYNYIGWVKTEDTAYCTNDEWKSIAENTDWLTVTGNRIILDVNNSNLKVSSKEFTMGTKFMLVKDKPLDVDGVFTESSYVVLIPTREENGDLKLVETRIPQGLDVTEGFLEYTPRNVITQAFKMLGERYGWGGLWNARDCASYIMDVYHCFGVNLPRNADSQAAVPAKRVDVSKYSDEQKEALILKQPIGTLLEINGHIMIFIGEYENKPFVIQQAFSFIPKEDEKLVTAGCSFVSNLEIKRGNTGKSFLREIRTINAIQ